MLFLNWCVLQIIVLFTKLLYYYNIIVIMYFSLVIKLFLSQTASFTFFTILLSIPLGGRSE